MPGCSSKRIKAFGTGTQKVENELQNHSEGFKLIRMDMDTTSGKHGHQKILNAFRNKEGDILIGTQMVAKGHDFPDVTLVGILAADASLFSSDYRASERTFQLITQASGRLFAISVLSWSRERIRMMPGNAWRLQGRKSLIAMVIQMIFSVPKCFHCRCLWSKTGRGGG